MFTRNCLVSHWGSDGRGHLELNLIQDLAAAALYFEVLGLRKSELSTEEFNSGQGGGDDDNNKCSKANRPECEILLVSDCLGLGAWRTQAGGDQGDKSSFLHPEEQGAQSWGDAKGDFGLNGVNLQIYGATTCVGCLVQSSTHVPESAQAPFQALCPTPCSAS